MGVEVVSGFQAQGVADFEPAVAMQGDPAGAVGAAGGPDIAQGAQVVVVGATVVGEVELHKGDCAGVRVFDLGDRCSVVGECHVGVGCVGC